jgi:hypothetical protein
VKADEKTRTQVLAAVAVLMILILLGSVAMKNSSGPEPEALPVKRDDRSKGTSTITSNVDIHNLDAMQRTYQPIVDLDAFKVRNFNRPHRGPEDTATPSSGSGSTSPPGFTGLRVTGIYLDDHGYTVVLEDRLNGKGGFLKAGDKLGDRTVAEVRSGSVLLVSTTAPITTRTYEFGDRIDVESSKVNSQIKAWAPLATVASVTSSEYVKQLPQLDDQTRESVIEQLKKKARKSRGQDEPKTDSKGDAKGDSK